MNCMVEWLKKKKGIIMRNIKVKDIMTPEVVTITSGATVLAAARKMKEADCGFLPVRRGKDICGILTDRDIVIRALAEGNNPAAEKVESLMTPHVYCCNENEFVEDAVSVMYRHGVMRLLVKNHDGDLVGVKRTPEARDGQTVVARLDGELTIKRLSRTARLLRLLPRNPAYAPIDVEAGQDFAIEGVFCGLVRRG